MFHVPAVLDSMSKIPSGIFAGNIMDFGNYDECLNVNVDKHWGSFIGQHCMAILPLPVDSLGISNADIQGSVSFIVFHETLID